MENEPKPAVSAEDVEQAIIAYGHDAAVYVDGKFHFCGNVQALLARLNGTDLPEPQP